MARQKNPDKIDRREWVTRSFTVTRFTVKVWNAETEEVETVRMALNYPPDGCTEKRIVAELKNKAADTRSFLKCNEDFVVDTRILGVKVSKFLEDAEDLTDKL